MGVKMSPSTSLSLKTPDTKQVRHWRAALLQAENRSCGRAALLLGTSELHLFNSREHINGHVQRDF